MAVNARVLSSIDVGKCMMAIQSGIGFKYNVILGERSNKTLIIYPELDLPATAIIGRQFQGSKFRDEGCLLGPTESGTGYQRCEIVYVDAGKIGRTYLAVHRCGLRGCTGPKLGQGPSGRAMAQSVLCSESVFLESPLSIKILQ